eukprot:m.24490 g.24490  ORF g.24490 m.24490 type:complete len:261 (+) comp8596_c0_seq1:1487-2269(+)
MVEPIIPYEVMMNLQQRFLAHQDASVLSDDIRVTFEVEKMHWFYLDHCIETDPSLPRLTQFAAFFEAITPYIGELNHLMGREKQACDAFSAYKQTIPVCGCIILNPEMTKVVNVKGAWKNALWDFPRGKVNQGEDPVACAIRETYEELGFDVSNYIDPDYCVTFKSSSKKKFSLYCCFDVPENTEFNRDPTEISAYLWQPIENLKMLQKSAPLKHASTALPKLLARRKAQHKNRSGVFQLKCPKAWSSFTFTDIKLALAK